MARETDAEKIARFQAALDQLIERVAEDRYVLAIVLVGSLLEETAWERESMGVWIIEADNVSRRLRSDGKDERIFRILVEDGGPGIPTAHLERVFERFYRVDAARSREAGGTGLGLSIVKHLLAAHGGDVGIESRVGEGTTVWVVLPD